MHTGRGVDPVHRILRYVMVPQPGKLGVDKNPYMTSGFDVPKHIAEDAAKSWKALCSKPATADEVFRGFLAAQFSKSGRQNGYSNAYWAKLSETFRWSSIPFAVSPPPGQ